MDLFIYLCSESFMKVKGKVIYHQVNISSGIILKPHVCILQKAYLN